MQATGFKPCGGGRSSTVASDVTCSSRLKEAATAAALCHRGGGGVQRMHVPPYSESRFFQVKQNLFLKKNVQ